MGRWLLRNDPNPDVSFSIAVCRRTQAGITRRHRHRRRARPCWRHARVRSGVVLRLTVPRTTFGLLEAGTKTFPKHLNLPQWAPPHQLPALPHCPKRVITRPRRTIFLLGEGPATSRKQVRKPIGSSKSPFGPLLPSQTAPPNPPQAVSDACRAVWILDVGRFQSQSWLMSAPSSSSTVLTQLGGRFVGSLISSERDHLFVEGGRRRWSHAALLSVPASRPETSTSRAAEARVGADLSPPGHRRLPPPCASLPKRSARMKARPTPTALPCTTRKRSRGGSSGDRVGIAGHGGVDRQGIGAARRSADGEQVASRDAVQAESGRMLLVDRGCQVVGELVQRRGLPP